MTQPICCRLSAPAPLASASGSAPSTMAPVVIRIGRRRRRGGLDHRIHHARALLAQLVGELDDQDAVLGDQAHQRDEADLREHVQRAARQLQRRQRADHGQRHRQQDDEGVDEALELRRQHQEDEQQRQHEDHAQRARRGAELAARRRSARWRSPAAARARRSSSMNCQRLAQRIARRQVGRDGDRAPLVEVVQLARAHRLAHLAPATTAAPSSRCGRARRCVVDVLGRGAAAALGLHHARRTARRRACSA